ncbi:DNA repair protein RecN [Limnobacter parvus]|uniref:DNA repair protein RecN n=1 Tax=Limnobacter parvus TaxID=2939690 RepID=A0ABT1XFI4_9BURK|nr:DNA repair protein RecN [Limnobacter parvus]MCR2746053.1 DNA repair protein RecN [Limnobacter parvus]
MLSSLTIQDFVIVDKLDLHFAPGMSVLSGETGAGKSILIDALSLCLGARADASQVREGCDRANITAVFEINPAAKAILDEQSIDCSEGELHLRRAVESNGRSKAYINGTPVPASTLKDLSETLIDIHGQHAFQTLAKQGEQLRLLDDFGQHAALVQNTAKAYSAFKLAEKALKHAQSSQEDRAARLENLQWKMDSLAKVAPKPGEWETLSTDFDRLSHGAELIEGTQHASDVLSQNENALLDQLSHVIEKLSHLSTRDSSLESVVKTLSDGEILIREASYDLGNYLKHSDLDPETLAEVEARMSLWHETARKLRIQPETLHAELESVQAEIKGLEEGFDVEKLQKELSSAQKAYDIQAGALGDARRTSAKALSDRVTQSMQTLSMQGGVFVVDVSKGEPSPKGSDTVEFRVAGHPGVTPQAIQKVASGGELARISLAITVNTVESTAVPTLIFDEVDSGIGGAVAETVGRYLRMLAKNKQVLCVTHLPQVAAQGHNHFQVSKDITAQTTRSKIVLLESKARIEEIARMLGGQVITEATRTAAHEMIASANS